MTIKELRKAAGMTQAEFGRYFKLSPRTVEAWESVRECPVYLRELIEYKLIHESIIKKEQS